MLPLAVLLLLSPAGFFVWKRTGGYAAVRAAGGSAFPRAGFVRFCLAALACALAAQGALVSFAGSGAESGDEPPATAFALDATASMRVLDGENGASRLAEASAAMAAWKAAHPGSPAALVAFGASPETRVPRTAAADVLSAGLGGIAAAEEPAAGPEFFPGAVAEAAKRAGRGGQVVLLSDGGDPEDGKVPALSARNALEKAGVRLFAAGFGTDRGGNIPLGTDAFGETRYKKFGGENVVAGSNPERLRAFAEAAGGTWLGLGRGALEKLGAPSGGAGSPAWPWAAAALACAAISAGPLPFKKRT